MLLILAAPGDPVAIAVRALALDAGMTVLHTSDERELDVAVEHDGTSDPISFIWCRRTSTPVSAILNRGPWLPADTTDAFRAAEVTAALWAGMMFFPGAVVNRPSTRGLLPLLDPLGNEHGSRQLVGCTVARYRWPLEEIGGPEVNLHCPSEKTWLGRLGQGGAADTHDGPVELTAFDPSLVRRIVFAGVAAFEVSPSVGRLYDERAHEADSLRVSLGLSGPVLAIVTTQQRAGGRDTELLAASPMPQPSQYTAAAGEIHEEVFASLR